jgi:hypothetical protein
MTTNERLFVAGLMERWDVAIESGDRKGAIEVLSEVDMADQAGQVVDMVLANPAFYGFPRTP